MKFSCTQENLHSALSLVSPLAAKSTNLPVLNNVLLNVKDGVLKLLTTNLDIAVSTVVRGKMESEGSFTVQARLFADYVALLPKERVDIELKENEVFISCGNYSTSLKGVGVDDFPVIPEFEKKKKFTLDSQICKKGLQDVIFSVASDETRASLSGVYFQFKESKLVLAGTDSYRLAEKKLEIKGEFEEYSVILPYKGLQEVVRILDQGEEVELYISDNQALFVVHETEITTRIIEEKYPDYTQIIPQSYQTEVTVSVSEFMKVIKATGLFSRSGVNDIALEFYPTKKHIAVRSANTQLGASTTTLDVKEISGKENNIVFNYRYLVDGLSHMKTDDVIIKLVDDANPCVFVPNKKESEYLYIVMPIKQ